MTQQHTADDSPASALFPEFDTLYDLIANEVKGLTDAQLDWTSDEYAWAEWSIRNQLSHMASLLYRWLILRCGDNLFPDGDHGIADVQSIADSHSDRRLDDDKYWEIPVILGMLDEGIRLAQQVLSERTVGFMQLHSVTSEASASWDLMLQAHPEGISISEDGTQRIMRYDAMVRHIYFEETTHLFNIQRLKRAQGLPTVSEVPKVGYWAVEGWDVSEA